MAVKKTIDELISEKAFQQADTLTSKLADLNKEFDASIARAKQFSDAVGGAKGLKDVNVNSAKAAAELEKLNKITLQAATAQQNLNKATAQAEAAQGRLATQQEKQATTSERLAKAEAERNRLSEKRKKIVQESTAAEIAAAKQNAAGNSAITTTLNAQDIANAKAADSATARSAQTQRAGRAAQVAAVQVSEETAAVIANTTAVETNTAVQATGINNLGRGLTKGLGYLRTLAYVLPGIGIAGILNILIDNFSTLFSELTKGKFAIDAFAASGKALKAAFDGEIYKSAVSNVIDLKEQIKLANAGFIDGELVVQKYNSTIGETTGKVGTLDEVEKAITKNSRDYIKSMFYKAAAAAALSQGTDELVEATKNLANAQANLTLTQTDLDAIQKEIAKGGDNAEMYKGLLKMAQNAKKVDQQSVKDRKTTQDQLVNQTATIYDKLTMMANNFAKGFTSGNQQDIDTRRLNNSSEVQKLLLQRQADALNEQYENEKNSYSKRQGALMAYIELQKRIRGVELSQELSDVTLQADQKGVIQEKYNTDIEKITLDGEKRLRTIKSAASKQDIENLKKDLEIQKKTAKQIIDDQSSSLDERQDALDTYRQKSLKLISVTEQEQVKEAGNNSKLITSAHKDALSARLDVDTDYTKQVDKIYEDEYNRQIKAAQTHDKTLIDNQKTTTALRVSEVTDARNEAISDLNEQFKKGLINEQEYVIKRQVIEQSATSKILEIQIVAAKEMLRQQQEAGQDTASQAKTLSDLEIRLAEYTEQQKVDAYKAGARQRQELLNAEYTLIKDVFSAVQEIYNNGANAQKDRLDQQSQAIDDNASTEKETVEQSLLTQQKKEDKEKIIDAKAQARKAVIAQQQRKIAHDTAVVNKAISAINVAVSAAESIAKIQGIASVLLANPLTAAYAPIAFAQIPIVIASAAVQEAAILSAPVPAYAKGTDYHKGGAMIVGDAGQELVIHPDGKQYLTPDTDTLTSAPKGTKVISNPELVRMMATPEKVNYAGGQAVDISALVQAQKQTTKAIQAQKSTATLITKRGWARQQQRVQDWSNYRNNHFN